MEVKRHCGSPNVKKSKRCKQIWSRNSLMNRMRCMWLSRIEQRKFTVSVGLKGHLRKSEVKRVKTLNIVRKYCIRLRKDNFEGFYNRSFRVTRGLKVKALLIRHLKQGNFDKSQNSLPGIRYWVRGQRFLCHQGLVKPCKLCFSKYDTFVSYIWRMQ